MGSIPQVSAGTHLESLPPMSQTTLVQHGDHADDDLRKWNVDIIWSTWKNDQDRTTKDASPHRPDEKTIENEKHEGNKGEVYKRIRKGGRKLLSLRDDEETGEGSEQSSNEDQDSDVSFQEDNDEEVDKSEKEEEWVDFIKRSTKEAEEHRKKMNTPCWIETHRRMKWRMAMRIASPPKELWTSKIFEWHPGLDNKIRTNRSIGRPRQRWEDDINDFLRSEETEDARGNDIKNDWRKIRKNAVALTGRKAKHVWWGVLPLPIPHSVSGFLR